VRLIPPLVVSREEVDEGVAIWQKALTEAEAELGM
jgi:4-aminobutyrate aminotransferase-like enzyme